MLLCLDLATKTGWAVTSNSEVIASGVAVFAKGTHGQRFRAFRVWLQTMRDKWHFTGLVIEETISRAGRTSVDVSRILCGLRGVALEWCEAREVSYCMVRAEVWKKHIVGNGSAKKPQTMAKCVELGIVPHDDNEADAVCLAWYAIEFLLKEKVS